MDGAGHVDGAEGLVLHRAPEALDEGDTRAAANGTKARLGTGSQAPGAILALKLRAPIANDVRGILLCATDGTVEHAANLGSIGLSLEDRLCDNRAGVLIKHGTDPPVEGPAQRQAERKPRTKEATDERHEGQVGMPHVMRSLGTNARVAGPLRRWRWRGRRWTRRFGRRFSLLDTLDGGCGQGEARASE